MSTISEETKVRLPLRAAWGMAAFIATLSCTATFYLASINAKLAKIEEHVKTDWVNDEQRNWAHEFQYQNPTLKVPDVPHKP